MRELGLKHTRWLVTLALISSVTATALLVNSCSTGGRTGAVPLEIEGAPFVGDKVCFDCHQKITRGFPASAHARVRIEHSEMAGQTGCESCHGPASKHVAAGGGRGKFIINPGKEPQACFRCHLDVQAQFHFPQHHPVPEGKMNCVDCHDPHGPDIMKPAGGLAMARLNESCANCHREQTKPMIFEHAALREALYSPVTRRTARSTPSCLPSVIIIYVSAVTPRTPAPDRAGMGIVLYRQRRSTPAFCVLRHMLDRRMPASPSMF